MARASASDKEVARQVRDALSAAQLCTPLKFWRVRARPGGITLQMHPCPGRSEDKPLCPACAGALSTVWTMVTPLADSASFFHYLMHMDEVSHFEP